MIWQWVFAEHMLTPDKYETLRFASDCFSAKSDAMKARCRLIDYRAAVLRLCDEGETPGIGEVCRKHCPVEKMHTVEEFQECIRVLAKII